jgi:hypothetical protein
MTLREFKENLEEFIKLNPNSLDLEVITSIDDEGNAFNRVYCTPSKGEYLDGEFDAEGTIVNAVCIN